MKYWIIALLAGCMSLAQAGLFDDDELLPADEAFAFSAQVDGDHIRATWQLADGLGLHRALGLV